MGAGRGRVRNPLDLARVLVIEGQSVAALPILNELRPMETTTMTLNIDKEFKALIPPLTEEEHAALELSLLTDGCRDAITTWNGIIVDGHNRYEICQRNGIPFQIVERDFPDRNAVIVWMIQNQLGRRNIADYTRAKLALRLKDAIAHQAKARQKATQFGSDAVVENFPPPSKTRDELGKIADLSGKTIAKVETIERAAPQAIKQAAESETISIHRAYELTKALETVKEQNPKFYEETVDRGHILNLDGEDVPLIEADPTLIRVIATEDQYERLKRQEQHISAKQEAKRARQLERHLAKEETPLGWEASKAWKLIETPVERAHETLDAESVDWIVTDPPYGAEHLPLYGALARLAAHVLKPGGGLLCMTGQSVLPQVMAALGERLNYHWVVSYNTPGGQSAQLWRQRVNTFWKPVLWYVNGDYTGDWIGDVVTSETNEKNMHHWQQSESGMRDLMRRFVYPNQVILDPFTGASTTGVVALRLRCQYIGIDNDPAALSVSKERLTKCTHQTA